jgi:hypothetical protein
MAQSVTFTIDAEHAHAIQEFLAAVRRPSAPRRAHYCRTIGQRMRIVSSTIGRAEYWRNLGYAFCGAPIAPASTPSLVAPAQAGA